MSSDEIVTTIPLRKAYYVPRQKRANKAIRLIKEYVSRHLHVSTVKISNRVNEEIWRRNRERPPRRIRVKIVRIDEDTAEVLLPEEEVEE
ncbi:MAG: 50S ribosomal protein L31e [Thermoprotei archaeon]|nr:MAG: 50S ribosomal protein L31e [Thermoprotei archaeon]RLE89087.1 MAG: 50S ribosomal protein L31e [Thermoprotei archaeon]